MTSINLKGDQWPTWRLWRAIRTGGFIAVFVAFETSLQLTSAPACQEIGFASSITWPSGVSSASVAIGDLNGDGILDAVVANEGFRSGYSILLGRGRAEFAPPLIFGIDGVTPTMVILRDLNFDGKLDLVIGNRDSTGVVVLLGSGDGAFGVPQQLPSSGRCIFVTTADFNEDGLEDLVCTYEAGISVLLGRGDGTFSEAAYYDVLGSPTSMAIEDFNSDGHQDVAIAIPGVGIAFYHGRGDGTLVYEGRLDFWGQTAPIVTSDFNKDGNLDLASGTSWPEPGVRILLGSGSGSFAPPTYYRGASGWIVVDHFNNDDELDLAVAGSGAGSGPRIVSVLLGRGDGTFRNPIFCDWLSSPISVTSADLDGDGKPDLVSAGWNGSISVSKNIFVYPDDPFAIDCPDGVLRVSWPSGLTNALLEATGSLSPANWERVVSQPTIQNGRWELSVFDESQSKFFRLLEP